MARSGSYTPFLKRFLRGEINVSELKDNLEVADMLRKNRREELEVLRRPSPEDEAAPTPPAPSAKEENTKPPDKKRTEVAPPPQDGESRDSKGNVRGVRHVCGGSYLIPTEQDIAEGNYRYYNVHGAYDRVERIETVRKR